MFGLAQPTPGGIAEIVIAIAAILGAFGGALFVMFRARSLREQVREAKESVGLMQANVGAWRDRAERLDEELADMAEQHRTNARRIEALEGENRQLRELVTQAADVSSLRQEVRQGFDAVLNRLEIAGQRG